MNIVDHKRKKELIYLKEFFQLLPIIEVPDCVCDIDDVCKHWNGTMGYTYCYHLFTHLILKHKGDDKKAHEEYKKIMPDIWSQWISSTIYNSYGKRNFGVL